MQRFKILVALGGIMFFSTDAAAQEVTIQQNQLPAPIAQFVRKHYSSAQISNIIREKKLSKTEYEVRLDNGTKLEFANNKIEEIDGTQRIPNSAMPVKVVQYIKVNYPNNYATEWKLDSREQKVELNNGVELEFDRSGRFLRIDR